MFGDWGRLCEMTHIKFSLLLAVHLYYKVPWGKLGVCLSRHVRIEVKCYYHFSFVVLIQRICIFWPYMTKREVNKTSPFWLNTMIFFHL